MIRARHVPIHSCAENREIVRQSLRGTRGGAGRDDAACATSRRSPQKRYRDETRNCDLVADGGSQEEVVPEAEEYYRHATTDPPHGRAHVAHSPVVLGSMRRRAICLLWKSWLANPFAVRRCILAGLLTLATAGSATAGPILFTDAFTPSDVFFKSTGGTCAGTTGGTDTVSGQANGGCDSLAFSLLLPDYNPAIDTFVFGSCQLGVP